MVIVIGGTSGAGKTKLANTLMRSLGIPYVSVDHVMMGIYRSNVQCGFTPMSDVSLINHHIWPIVREMIKTNIENHHSVIFEGFQILPRNLEDFSDEYAPQLLPLFVTLAPDYIQAHYDRIRDHRSAIELRSDIDDQTTLMRRSAELIDACRASLVRCHVIASDYEAEMRRIAHEVEAAFRAGPGGTGAMQRSSGIAALLQPLFDAYDVAMTPASESSLQLFRARAVERTAPDAVVAQLTDFYSVVDGVPCLDSLNIYRCDDPTIFEWWEQRELWLGQRDDTTLRWSSARDAFCIGDASNVSFSPADEHRTLAAAIQQLLRLYD